MNNFKYEFKWNILFKIKLNIKTKNINTSLAEYIRPHLHINYSKFYELINYEENQTEMCF